MAGMKSVPVMIRAYIIAPYPGCVAPSGYFHFKCLSRWSRSPSYDVEEDDYGVVRHVEAAAQLPEFECGRLLLTQGENGMWSTQVDGVHFEDEDQEVVLCDALECVEISGYYTDGTDEHGVKGYNVCSRHLMGDPWIDDMPTLESAMQELWRRLTVKA
jgi:hypothetical protein